MTSIHNFAIIVGIAAFLTLIFVAIMQTIFNRMDKAKDEGGQ